MCDVRWSTAGNAMQKRKVRYSQRLLQIDTITLYTAVQPRKSLFHDRIKAEHLISLEYRRVQYSTMLAHAAHQLPLGISSAALLPNKANTCIKASHTTKILESDIQANARGTTQREKVKLAFQWTCSPCIGRK
jgi:hypothetical protein